MNWKCTYIVLLEETFLCWYTTPTFCTKQIEFGKMVSDEEGPQNGSLMCVGFLNSAVAIMQLIID